MYYPLFRQVIFFPEKIKSEGTLHPLFICASPEIFPYLPGTELKKTEIPLHLPLVAIGTSGSSHIQGECFASRFYKVIYKLSADLGGCVFTQVGIVCLFLD